VIWEDVQQEALRRLAERILTGGAAEALDTAAVVPHSVAKENVSGAAWRDAWRSGCVDPGPDGKI
jgi:hypothetical protein